jgi:hypothetical protein
MLTMRGFRGTIATALVVLTAGACGSPGTPTLPAAARTALTATPPVATTATLIESAPIPIFATASQVAAQPTPVFTVAVIVDMRSEPVRREQAQGVIGEASGFLSSLTSIDLLMTDFVEDGGGGSTNDMASRYINAHPGALPNGIVVFSFGDDGQAKAYGGYNYALAGPAGYKNAFVSPVTGDGQIYVAVVHFSHKYAPCGYGGSDTLQSTVSLDGECRNQPGTACVQHNGYSMCSDSAGHLYASRPTYFISSTIIHELMHPFSPGGDKDHYSTPECNTRMGYPAQFHDLQEAQYHNDLCPYVFDEFYRSYQP